MHSNPKGFGEQAEKQVPAAAHLSQMTALRPDRRGHSKQHLSSVRHRRAIIVLLAAVAIPSYNLVKFGQKFLIIN
jgi:hypothetical protein